MWISHNALIVSFWSQKKLYFRRAVPDLFDELVCLLLRAGDQTPDRFQDGYRTRGILVAEVCGGERKIRLHILRLRFHARFPDGGDFVVASARHVGRRDPRIGGGAGDDKGGGQVICRVRALRADERGCLGEAGGGGL